MPVNERRIIIVIFSFLLATVPAKLCRADSCADSGQQLLQRGHHNLQGSFQEDGETYVNPVWNNDFPDPSVVRGGDGRFYAYGTGNAPFAIWDEMGITSPEQRAKYVEKHEVNIKVLSSPDLVHWTSEGMALKSPQDIAWSDGLQFWAPDVSKQSWNGEDWYVMYYAAQLNGEEENHKCIGAALSQTATGPFQDVGEPVLCRPGYVAIDPHRVDVGAESFLFWGSGVNGSIFMTPLQPNGWGLLDGDMGNPVLHSDFASEYEGTIEGVWVDHDAHAPGGPTWWLYYSGSNCCGDEAHYGVSVAGSRNLTGLYHKKAFFDI
mmetsp:Transcript_5952/g.10691  ORF Transcript_5952/g.10691 Transcript_5952/m.10691 type:complete len:320 (+) Transcript_5952:38-997(+)